MPARKTKVEAIVSQKFAHMEQVLMCTRRPLKQVCICHERNCQAFIFIRPDFQRTINQSGASYVSRETASDRKRPIHTFLQTDLAAKTNMASFSESRIDLLCIPAHFCHLKRDWLTLYKCSWMHHHMAIVLLWAVLLEPFPTYISGKSHSNWIFSLSRASLSVITFT